MKFALPGLCLLTTAATAQILMQSSLSLHDNRAAFSVGGLAHDTSCDVLYSSVLGDSARWTLYLRGVPGQTNFSLALPETATGFFRARTIPSSPGFDPADFDGDGVPNTEETIQGTDWLALDSDDDGVTDGQDLFPLDPSRWQTLPQNPQDRSAPIITLIEPAWAVSIP